MPNSPKVLEAFYEAHKTDVESVETTRLRMVLARIASERPTSVLDVGCGRGALLQAIKALVPGTKLTGIDISESSVQAARLAGFESLSVDIGEADLPFATDAFDCVIFGEVIEHLVDPDAALVRIAKVLKPGGLLILTTPNLASWINRVLLFVGIQPIFTETSLSVNLGRRWKFLGQHGPTQGHLKVFTLEALREMLAANGYHIVSLQGAPFIEAGLSGALDKIVSHVPNFASDFIIAARNSASRRTLYENILPRTR